MSSALEDLAIDSALTLLATLFEPPVRRIYDLLVRSGIAEVVPVSA